MLLVCDWVQVMGAVGYNHKSDVYSFAIVLWELCTRRLPFEDLTPLQAAFAVCEKVRNHDAVNGASVVIPACLPALPPSSIVDVECLGSVK